MRSKGFNGGFGFFLTQFLAFNCSLTISKFAICPDVLGVFSNFVNLTRLSLILKQPISQGLTAALV